MEDDREKTGSEDDIASDNSDDIDSEEEDVLDEAGEAESDDQDDEGGAGDGEGDDGDQPAPSDKERKKPRIFHATVITLCVLILLAYAVNVYLNVTVVDEVREHCWAENQRLADAINAATEDRLPALDWMVALYRARRRYAREICDETVIQLAWWRWNVGRRIEADISPSTQEDISKTLARASLSCEHEIQTMNKLMQRELTARGSDGEVLARADEMINGQLESCRELRSAVAESRPGFWPPLVANGQLEVPVRLRAMMPRALHVLARSDGTERSEEAAP